MRVVYFYQCANCGYKQEITTCKVCGRPTRSEVSMSKETHEGKEYVVCSGCGSHQGYDWQCPKLCYGRQVRADVFDWESVS